MRLSTFALPLATIIGVRADADDSTSTIFVTSTLTLVSTAVNHVASVSILSVSDSEMPTSSTASSSSVSTTSESSSSSSATSKSASSTFSKTTSTEHSTTSTSASSQDTETHNSAYEAICPSNTVVPPSVNLRNTTIYCGKNYTYSSASASAASSASAQHNGAAAQKVTFAAAFVAVGALIL